MLIKLKKKTQTPQQKNTAILVTYNESSYSLKNHQNSLSFMEIRYSNKTAEVLVYEHLLRNSKSKSIYPQSRCSSTRAA